MDELKLSPFQQRVLEIPEDFDVFLGGGRGGSKSFTLALLAMRHVAQYGAEGRVLYLRQTYKGLADFELICRQLFAHVFGTDARYNGSEKIWRFPGGGYLELGQLENAADYSKYQGHSYSLLLVDEAGQYAMPDLLDLMRSNLRGSRAVPIRVVMAANPAGSGHHWIARRYVFRSAPWKPFFEDKSKREWVYAPSTYLDNPHIDQLQYRDQLESSCPSDKDLLRAWTDGDWTVARGAYFAGVLEEARNAVGPFTEVPKTHGTPWDTWLAHDFGSTAPAVTYLMARSPGAEHEGQFYPRDSVVILDERAVYRPDALNQGLGWTASKLGEDIVEWCREWGVKPQGSADDAIFSRTGHAATIADEFARAGVTFWPARKEKRVPGWDLMRRLLADAGKPDRPGLYISRACEYFWATVPYLARDPKRVEDLASDGPDHAADSVRYGLLRQDRRASVSPLRL